MSRQAKKIRYLDLPWCVEGVFSFEELDGYVDQVFTGTDDDMNLYQIILRLPGKEGLWAFDDGWASLACISYHEQWVGKPGSEYGNPDYEIELYPVREVQTTTYERDD